MDQPAADVPEKTQKPENEENYKYGPQHNSNFMGKKIKSKIGMGSQEATARCILSRLLV